MNRNDVNLLAGRLLLPQRWRPTSPEQAERWDGRLDDLERQRAGEECA